MIFAFYFTFLCHVCPNYPHTGLTTAMAPSGRQMAIVVSRTVYSPNFQTSWSHLRMPMMYIKSTIWSGFEIKHWIEDQFQSSPKLVGTWTVLRCIFVPNLVIVTSIGGELWHEKAQNGENFDFGVQFDLEGQGQSPCKTIGILTKVFYTYGPNLVILAWTGDELSHG